MEQHKTKQTIIKAIIGYSVFVTGWAGYMLYTIAKAKSCSSVESAVMFAMLAAVCLGVAGVWMVGK